MAKEILSLQDVVAFVSSKSCEDLLQFIGDIGKSIRDIKLSTSEGMETSAVLTIVSFLNKIRLDIYNFPPDNEFRSHQNRFGSKRFRDWHKNLTEKSSIFIKSLFEYDLEYEVLVELEAHLNDGFGNATRIDYGTGHELSFMIFLFCLSKLGILTSSQQVGATIFPVYINTVRALQSIYKLEPAGSHGAWSLDDYQMLVFFFGASQMISSNPAFSPKILRGGVKESTSLQTLTQDYLLLSQLDFLASAKSGTVKEYSPLLYELGGFKSWEDLSEGLLRMFKGEVLGKFPVAQHIHFGSIFIADWAQERVKTFASKATDTTMSPFAQAELQRSVVLGFPGATDLISKYFKKSKDVSKASSFLNNLKGGLLKQAENQQAQEESGAVDHILLKNNDGIEIRGWKILCKSNSLSAYETEKETLQCQVKEVFNLPEVDIRFPDLCFLHNFVKLSFGNSLSLEFLVKDALLGCNFNVQGMGKNNFKYYRNERKKVQVKHAAKWKKRADVDGNLIKEIDSATDWTYTTSYTCSSDVLEENIHRLEKSGIDYELLKRKDPILYYAKVIFFEDDLFDFGDSKYEIKVRVMPTCWFILARLCVRLDGEFLRVFDSRFFHSFGSTKVFVEITRKEGDLERLNLNEEQLKELHSEEGIAKYSEFLPTILLDAFEIEIQNQSV